MKCLLQKVKFAEVYIKKKKIASCSKGLLIYCGISSTDDAITCKNMAKKVANIRLFEDQSGVMNHSVIDDGLATLLVPNFTLYAQTKKGNRPFYGEGATPEKAKQLFELLFQELQRICPTEAGEFGANMSINCSVIGPANIIIEL